MKLIYFIAVSKYNECIYEHQYDVISFTRELEYVASGVGEGT